MNDLDIALDAKQNEISESKDNSQKIWRDGKFSYQPKVLMYHRIVEDKALSNQQKECLHIDDFKLQLKLLNQMGFTPVTFRDYHLFQEDKIRLPKKPVILTFDDGYEDFYQTAYPILKEQGMKAVVFVLGDPSIGYNCWDADLPGRSQTPLMSDEQISELYTNGFEIGSHTLSHSNLKMLNHENCYTEIYKSKLILEALLDTEIMSFSYPYGLLNEKVKSLVKKAGYQFACGVFSGPAEFGKDPFEIRRIAIHSSISLGGFMMRLLVPYEYAEWMWWKTQSTRRSNGVRAHK